MRALARALWLLGVWLILWGEVTPANVLSGLLVAGAVQLLPSPGRRAGALTFRPLAALRYLLHFLRQLVGATLFVARLVMLPQHRVRAAIVAVPLRSATDGLITLVADTVTLTPGTLTLVADKETRTLYVHALYLHDLDAVRRGIRHLDELAIRAFGSERARAALSGDGSAPGYPDAPPPAATGST